MNEFQPFHSAVNRIPVLRASAGRLARAGRLPSLFVDGPAPGHDHIAPDRWSGSIDLEMTVRTPLVFGEQHKEVRKGSDGRAHNRRFVNVPTDDDGHLVVPPTMVKGMVSRAFESLTCSRFRVFDDHDERLTYHGDPASALHLVPIRIHETTEDGGLVGDLLYGDTRINGDYCKGRVTYPTMSAAALQASQHGHARLVLAGGMKHLEAMTPHGKEITCRMTLCLHGSRGKGARYAYWQVTHIRQKESYVEVFRIDDSVDMVEEIEGVTGYVCRTAADGDSPKDLFSRKHDERLFFCAPEDRPQRVTISKEVCDAYRIVVESYVRERNEEREGNRHKPNRATARAQKDRENGSTLGKGDLAYAVVEDGPSDSTPTVREIVPTMIGRHAYAVSPRELARDQMVLPLSGRGEASAADRLFGYVVPRPDENAKGGDVSSRGRVSFGVVDTSSARVSTEEKILTPMLGPKVSSVRRFLTDASGATPKDDDGSPLARSRYFSRGQHLGSAAYPVHRRAVESGVFPAQATRTPVMAGRQQGNLNVRLTAQSWVEAGSILSCTLSFSNLSKDELGALVWVLTPENLVPASERSPANGRVGYLRMGLGKPFGLGALEIRISEGGLRARSGADLARSYASLEGVLGLCDPVRDVGQFPLPHEQILLQTPWVQALQRAAFGYTDGVEVRHMSLEENKENNRTDFRTGLPTKNRGLSPVDLSGRDSGHSTQISRERRNNTRSGQRRPGGHWHDGRRR